MSRSFYAQQNAENPYSQQKEIDAKPFSKITAVNSDEKSSDEEDLTNFGNEFNHVIAQLRTIVNPQIDERNYLTAWLCQLDSDL